MAGDNAPDGADETHFSGFKSGRAQNYRVRNGHWKLMKFDEYVFQQISDLLPLQDRHFPQ